MPLDNVIREVSSGSDTELVAAPKEPARPAKRRRRQKSAPVAEPREVKSSAKFLRSILGRECSCKKRDCLQQFIPEEDFQSLLEYRRHWCDLLKLDQDSYASCRLLGLNFQVLGRWPQQRCVFKLVPILQLKMII